MAAARDVVFSRSDLVLLLDIRDRQVAFDRFPLRDEHVCTGGRMLLAGQIRLALLGPTTPRVHAMVESVEDDPALGDGFDIDPALACTALGVGSNLCLELIVTFRTVAGGRMACVADPGVCGFFILDQAGEPSGGATVKKHQLRASLSILFAKASETLVHELDSRVARERRLAVELWIEDEHRLDGRPLRLGHCDSSFNCRVVLDPEVGTMPEENHVSTR